MSSTALLRGNPAGSVTVRRSSPVVLCANMGRAHKNAVMMSAFFIVNCQPSLSANLDRVRLRVSVCGEEALPQKLLSYSSLGLVSWRWHRADGITAARLREERY